MLEVGITLGRHGFTDIVITCGFVIASLPYRRSTRVAEQLQRLVASLFPNVSASSRRHAELRFYRRPLRGT